MKADRRAQSARPQGMSLANSLREAKGGACPPFLRSYLNFIYSPSESVFTSVQPWPKNLSSFLIVHPLDNFSDCKAVIFWNPPVFYADGDKPSKDPRILARLPNRKGKMQKRKESARGEFQHSYLFYNKTTNLKKQAQI